MGPILSMAVTTVVGIILCVFGAINMTGNISSLHSYHRSRVREEDKDRAVNDPNVLEALKKAEAELNGSGRVLLRKSGTEPLIRVMAEAADSETCKKSIRMITDAIEKCGYSL